MNKKNLSIFFINILRFVFFFLFVFFFFPRISRQPKRLNNIKATKAEMLNQQMLFRMFFFFFFILINFLNIFLKSGAPRGDPGLQRPEQH